jgi:hypothetical protein
MSPSGFQLDTVLQRVRDAYVDLRSQVPDEAHRETIDALLERLADLADEDGSILLGDGSRLYVMPERGDRSGETGRIGVVQRFADGRPEHIHLVTA